MHCTALFPAVRLAVLAPRHTTRVSVSLRFSCGTGAPRQLGAWGAVGIQCGWARKERFYLLRSLAEPEALAAAAFTPGRGGRTGAQSAWRRRLGAGAIAAPGRERRRSLRKPGGDSAPGRWTAPRSTTGGASAALPAPGRGRAAPPPASLLAARRCSHSAPPCCALLQLRAGTRPSGWGWAERPGETTLPSRPLGGGSRDV